MAPRRAVSGRLISRAGAQPRVSDVRLALPGLPDALHGLTLLFVTDIHYGRWFHDADMEKLTRAVQAIDADVLALGGDLAENLDDERALCERFLARWPAKQLKLCVPGNNDYEAFRGDYAPMRALLDRAGFRLLVNERAELPVPGGRLVVHGLDESKYGQPDGATLDEPARPGDLTVLLTHSPWALDMALTGARRADLVLCGHTHGGQIALGPLTPYALGYERRALIKRRYFFLAGDRVINGMRIIVSNGIGMSLVPLRVGAPPEIHRITFSGQSGENERNPGRGE